MPASPSTTTAHRAAGVLFILAPCWYLFCEMVAALGFPGYDYARNYISDLGVPAGGVLEGRAMDSRLAEVMNAGFIGEGLLITLGVVLLIASGAGRSRRFGVLAALLLVHSVGIAVVGLVHGSPANVANGLMAFHGLGAVAAIGAGNAAALVAGLGDALSSHDAVRHRAVYRTVSTVLGAAGFLFAVLLVTHFQLPDGVWERGSVYTIIAWQLLTGVVLLRRNPVAVDNA
ncbi:DUF998 domain-containing protein [Arthrobacter sp. NPDC090010]|uniref:DUF998 domain-containing protein n=1 Tax=Arthrobacter sp. NPDC090010 TaxID=3363942 RepID=UPI0037FB49D6